MRSRSRSKKANLTAVYGPSSYFHKNENQTNQVCMYTLKRGTRNLSTHTVCIHISKDSMAHLSARGRLPVRLLEDCHNYPRSPPQVERLAGNVKGPGYCSGYCWGYCSLCWDLKGPGYCSGYCWGSCSCLNKKEVSSF